MFDLSVFFKRLVTLLQFSALCSTNETFIFDIFLNLYSLVSQSSKSVNHYALHNICEEESEKYSENHVKEEFKWIPIYHTIAYDS